MKVLFLGTSDFGIPTLEALAADSRHVLRVITKPDALAGRGRRVFPPPIKKSALALGLEISQPERIDSPEAAAWARAFAPDVILVVSYAQKIPEAFLDLAPYRGINIHPSLLPKYRGAAPIPFAILNGDATTGVSIIRVAPRMDSGDILGRIETSLGEDETAAALHDRLARAAVPLVFDVLEGLEKGTIVPIVQDGELVTKAFLLKKEDGLVDWTRPAVVVGRQIRAMTPWPGAYTFLETGGRRRIRLTLHETVPEPERAVDVPPGTLLDGAGRFLVACGSGAIEIATVQREGKKTVSGGELLRGIRLEASQCLLTGPGAST